MEEPVKHAERYRTPTRYDLEPHGSLWHIKIDENSYDIWIQTNKDHMDPHWLRLGPFFEKALGGLVEDQEFINECLELYHNPEHPEKIRDSILSH